MPLSDEQSKQAYDSTLQPDEEQRKYWDVHSTVTLNFIVPRYGTRAEVEDIQKRRSTAFADAMNPDNFTVEITSFEQEGE